MTALAAWLNTGHSWIVAEPLFVQFSAGLTLFFMLVFAFGHLRLAWIGRARSQPVHSVAVQRQLPKMRPRLAPSNYCKNPHRLGSGFEVSNHGRDAYDISVPPIWLGQMRVFVSGRIGHLSKHGKMFCAVNVQREHEILVGALFDQMCELKVEKVAMSIFYRDFDQNWYATDFSLSRNVYIPSGMEISNIAQRAADGPPSASPDAPSWSAHLLDDTWSDT